MRPKLITNPTRNKLDESTFFLEAMIENIENEKQFCWFLSAFLQAARSITFFMQKQYCKVSGFPKWYCQKQTEMIADDDMSYLNKARVETVHKKPTTTGINAVGRMRHDVQLIKADVPPPPPVEGVEQGDNKKTTSNIVGYTFVDYHNTDVVPFCESQLNKLKKIVIECEDKYL